MTYTALWKNNILFINWSYAVFQLIIKNNVVAIAIIFVSGNRTRRRDTFFCAAKRKYPKKRRLGCRFFLRSSVLSGVGREGFLPSYRRTASMPGPFVLIPTKPAVLGAANEWKQRYCVTSVIKARPYKCWVETTQPNLSCLWCSRLGCMLFATQHY